MIEYGLWTLMIMYYLSIQCQGHVITEDYMDFPKAACPEVSEPCWIPQIQSILPTAIISRLSQCDSMEKYKCMLLTVMYSRKNVKRRCKKSCKAENYKIISRTGTIEPFTKVTHIPHCSVIVEHIKSACHQITIRQIL